MLDWFLNLFKKKPKKKKPLRYSVSPHGLKIIKEFEGYRSHAYLCSAGVWTIGYGTTYYTDGTKVEPGDIISEDLATHLLKLWIKDNFDPIINVPELLILKLKQNQIDALASFVYNVGVNAFKNSTLRKKLIDGESINVVALEFLKWDKYTNPKTGKLEALEGLTRRRKTEFSLFRIIPSKTLN